MNRSKVLKYAILSVAGAFLLSTVISLVSLHSMVRHNQRELNKVLAAQIYDTISIELSEPAVIARTMSYDRFLIELLENERSYPEEEIRVGSPREFVEQPVTGLAIALFENPEARAEPKSYGIPDASA